MNIHNQGPRQVFLYNHGRTHWTQGGPIFYDHRRINHQVAIGTGQFQGQWFRGPVVPAGPQNSPPFQNFRVNISWNGPLNGPFHNNLNIHFGRNFVNRVHYRTNMIGGRQAPQPMLGVDEDTELCFICGDYLQNCNEPGVHMCDGGRDSSSRCNQNARHSSDADQRQAEINKDNNIKTKLETVLQNVQDSLKNDYKTVSEALEKYLADRISEISTIHREVSSRREALTKLQLELEARTKDLEVKEKKLVESQNQFTKERQRWVEDSEKERMEIARQWQQLKDEITRMEELHDVQKGRVKLDVGGHVYTTSLLTLTRDAESMLAAMFSGRHEIRVEQDGTVFIDRDGTHFRHILNYLRDGGVTVDSLPRSRQVLKELRNEAVYYQLHGLVQQIEKFL
ncbi:uncharacterized protein LOC124257984 [Haliotis rubra]|uniref:uncharacterized protein LOC124257984 n=1 Tax=Haliotis rubra TaxID=36100 RepID=UPI001EE55494|nr:uncharacterized protein LOC124257984 [Haliotis rubra]XP_046548018.1 uncharacterized protein LOC124257984 [Haliotis rubra]XP_046548019.1 uncharacterized protein LOC124257984 [Haliotis rubra]